MIGKKNFNDSLRHFCLGILIYLILFVIQISANPSVGSSIKRNAGGYSITIYAKSMGSILNGDIYCEYDPGLSIDKASILSPISGLAIGASLNRTVYSMHITIAARGTVTLDSAVIAILEIPFSGNNLNNYTFKIDSASFMDHGGTKRTADIIPLSIVVPLYSIKKVEAIKSNRYYMLNGKLLPQTVGNYKKKLSVNNVHLKILYDCRRN